MVIVQIAREVLRAGARLYGTGPKFWGSRGYKQGYRQSIDHIVWIGGATAETFKSLDQPSSNNNGQIPTFTPSSKFVKTYSGSVSNRRRWYPSKQCPYGCRPKSRSNYSRPMRYRR